MNSVALKSDCINVQADLELHRLHIYEGVFSCDISRIFCIIPDIFKLQYFILGFVFLLFRVFKFFYVIKKYMQVHVNTQHVVLKSNCLCFSSFFTLNTLIFQY